MNKPSTQYFIIPNSIFLSDKFSTPAEIMIFISILRFCNWSEKIYIGVDTLAKCSKTSKKTVIKILKSLEEKGVIKTKRSKNRATLFEVIWNYEGEHTAPPPVTNFHLGGNNLPSEGVIELPVKESFKKNSLKELGKQEPLKGDNLEEDISAEVDARIEARIADRRRPYEQIIALIVEATGVNKRYVESGVPLLPLTTEQLYLLIDRIRESSFLSGKVLNRKPTLTHFSSLSKLYKILGGGYKNFDTGSYSYQTAFVPRDLEDAEPEIYEESVADKGDVKNE